LYVTMAIYNFKREGTKRKVHRRTAGGQTSNSFSFYLHNALTSI